MISYLKIIPKELNQLIHVYLHYPIKICTCVTIDDNDSESNIVKYLNTIHSIADIIVIRDISYTQTNKKEICERFCRENRFNGIIEYMKRNKGPTTSYYNHDIYLTSRIAVDKIDPSKLYVWYIIRLDSEVIYSINDSIAFKSQLNSQADKYELVDTWSIPTVTIKRPLLYKLSTKLKWCGWYCEYCNAYCNNCDTRTFECECVYNDSIISKTLSGIGAPP